MLLRLQDRRRRTRHSLRLLPPVFGDTVGDLHPDQTAAAPGVTILHRADGVPGPELRLLLCKLLCSVRLRLPIGGAAGATLADSRGHRHAHVGPLHSATVVFAGQARQPVRLVGLGLPPS